MAEVEAAGVRFFTRVDSLWCPAVARLCSTFPVWKGACLGTADQPRLIFERPHPLPFLTDDPLSLNKAVEREAYREDIQAKLSRIPSGERHLFVRVEEQAFGLWMQLCTTEYPPGESVRLPEQVDVIWLAADWHAQQRVVWRARRGDLWDVVDGWRQWRTGP